MRTSSYGINNTAKATTIFLCIAVICAAIWAASSDVAGSYISEKILAPLFKSEPVEESVATAEPTQEAVEATPAPASSVTITTQLNYAGKQIYFVQLGAYNSLANAKTASQVVTSIGGAGYIITHQGYHKVYATGFFTESDAKKAKDEFILKGYDAFVNLAYIDGVSLNIAAEQGQIDALDRAHLLWIECSESLFELSRKFDAKSISREQLNSEALLMRDDLSKILLELEEDKDTNQIIMALYADLKLCEDGLTSLTSNALSDVEVSSSLKYLMIDFIYRFGQYSNNIAT